MEVKAASPLSIKIKVPDSHKGPLFIVFDLNKNKKTGSHKFIRTYKVEPNPEAVLNLLVPGYLSKCYIRLFTLKDGNLSQIGNGLRMYVMSHNMLDGKDFIKSFQNSFKKMGKKLLFLQHLINVSKKYANNNYGTPEISGNEPVWWWDSQIHDKMLLEAIYKLGASSYHASLKNSEEYGFTGDKFKAFLEERRKTVMEKDSDTKSEDLDANEFPSMSLLNKRAQKIIDKLLVVRRMSY